MNPASSVFLRRLASEKGIATLALLMRSTPLPSQIPELERPHCSLWTYYVICGVMTGPGMIVALPYLYFRYHTLRYHLDDEGIHMKVGILFRTEVNLTYARIQDIHLHSNFIQRWLGLANVQIQTASGSSGAELVIEGFKEYEAIRDFLYTRMRGYKEHKSATNDSSVKNASANTGENPEVVELLKNICDELRRTRELLAAEPSRSPASPPLAPPHV
ncbi:MAG: PH domain-containing protein [Verrucomicrobiota bacterium]